VTTTVPPPVPFDPELAAALSVLHEQIPAALTADMIPMMRAGAAAAGASDDQLSRGGKYAVAARTVPGRPGDPDISLLICTPTDAAGPRPCFYHTHGGGMILGDYRIGLLELLEEAERYGWSGPASRARWTP